MKAFHRFLLIGLLAAAPHLVAAADASSVPILRIETGSHGATVWNIATDASSRWLVSSSIDKTARVWDLQNQKLLRVLRPPLGEGEDGKLYGVAMSPDGTYVATGGWSGNGGDRDHAIYVFERSTGRLVLRIGGQPNVIDSLAWSPDGHYLAAGLSGKNGIRIFRTEDFSLIGEDREYGESVYGLDFDRQSRLVTSSYDGFLRLYRVAAGGAQRILKKAAPCANQPRAVRFSPDGTQIAVGSAAAVCVQVVSADTLEAVAAPDTASLKAYLATPSVTWSPDGSLLYAAVNPRDDAPRLIRSWPSAAWHTFQDDVVANNAIIDIRTLADGAVAFAAGGGYWGVLERAKRQVRVVRGQTSDFRGNSAEFGIARDGLVARFAPEYLTKTPARFNLLERQYENAADNNGVQAPRTTAAGIRIQNWANNLKPLLNGTLLKLGDYESSRSIAIAPDDQSFLLGADWHLYRFTRDGKALWQHVAPATVWNVNVSADGRLAVAAYGDGTIRWHRMSDGKELAAFFPHPDRKRWVLWTPSGYYDASPGGEELIGWHINRGKDHAADFFAASRLRAQFYRPDVIANVFRTLDEGEALRLANADAGGRSGSVPVKVQDVLPPVVEILSPLDGSPASSPVTLKLATRSPGDAPVTGLQARVNGKPVSISEKRNITIELNGDAREITIPVPLEDSEIQIFATNRHGVSAPAVLHLARAGKGPAREEDLYKPKLYVLAVGVSQYANPAFNLGLADKDARDFAAVLQRQQGKLYSGVQVRLLTDNAATKDGVLEGLEWLKREVTAHDVGMMFLAGHGMNDNTGKYYFMPYNGNPDSLLRTAVPQTDIRDTLNSLAGKAVFFVDTCHSGNALGTAKTRGLGTDVNAFINELASAENGVVVFTAATGRQFSLEDPSWGNGAFTKAVVEGLSGKADLQHTGRITHKGLDYYVAERVKQLTGGRQSPTSIAPSGVTDFPIAVVTK